MKRNYFMINIAGNVEEEALNVAVTEIARYREFDDSTLIRMYAKDEKCGLIIDSLYGGLGEIKHFEYGKRQSRM